MSYTKKNHKQARAERISRIRYYPNKPGIEWKADDGNYFVSIKGRQTRVKKVSEL